MKKLLALVLAGAMAFSMVACGSKDNGGEAEGEKLKVALVCTQLGDKSFNDSADAGLKALAEEGLIEYKAIEYGNDNSVVDQEMLEAAQEYDVVCCNNLGYGMATSWCSAHAAEYPDTWFLIYDEPTEVVDAPNVVLMAYRANESDFLAGVVAASESETGVVGFVGGMETPVIWDFLVGYIEGAKWADPEVKVLVAYTNSYTDASKGSEIGNQFLNQGCDVMHGVAGTAGNGALEAAAKAGKLCIGVDSDQYLTMMEGKPEVAEYIITSALKNVGDSLVSVIREIAAGTYVKEGDRAWFGGEGGYIGVAENENFDKLASEATKTLLADAKAKIASGEIVVSSAYDMSAEQLAALVDSAK